jgi:hypothetical protein
MKVWLPDIGPVNELRLKVGSYFLKQEMRNRNRQSVGVRLEDAKTIGILFNADGEKAFKLVREFSELLRDGGKRKIKALGFVPKVEVASFLQTSQDFDFFSKEELNWYFRPQGEKVSGFTKESFDILIDLRVERFIPFLFLVGLSKAKFKVGRYGAGLEEFYDLMIEVDDKTELEFFITQTKRYLDMIDSARPTTN